MDTDQKARLDHVFAKWDKASSAQQRKAEAVGYGKEKWTKKFGCNPAAIPRLARTFRTPSQRQKLQHEGYRGFVPNLGINIAQDKTQIRSKCCYKCTPHSRQEWEAHSDKSINFTLNSPIYRLGLMHYWFNDMYTCAKLNTTDLPDIKQAVLESEEVKAVKDTYTDSKEADMAALCLFRKMAAKSTRWLARAAGWTLFKIFRYSTTGIYARSSDVDVLRQAVERKVPILYLPLHRSHLDYIILMWVLCLLDLPLPFVAAGDNLDIPIVGTFMRMLGAFFIRRRPKEDHHLYKAVLGQYVLELVKSGCSIEFFLEGRRSRSGLINPTKIGLLTHFVNAVRDGEVSDVLICPLSLTYDKIPEDSLTNELRGASKEPESFLSAFWHTITFPFKHNYGSIMVNFSEPFSLVEYIEKCYREVRVAGDEWTSLADVSPDGIVRLTTHLGEHILHSGMETSSISSTALFSLLLLSANGPLSQSQLEKKGHVWNDIIKSLGKSCSFTFDTGYLTQPLTMFAAYLYTEQWNIGGQTVTVYSKGTSLEVELLLHYYTVPLLITTLPISALCISILKIIKTNGTKTYVSKILLMQRTLYCCSIINKLIKCEPPCTPLDQVLSFHLDSLYTLNILRIQQNAMSTEEMRRLHRAAAQWDDDTAEWGEHIDDELLIEEDNISIATVAASSLIPYLDLLWFVLGRVSDLPMPRNEFVTALSELGAEEHELRTGLCSSLVHLTAVVDRFIEVGILKQTDGVLSVTNEYNNTQQFLDTVAYLSTYT